jgi:hypothetical protein
MRSRSSSGKGGFSVAGLFRELHVEFKERNDSAGTLISAGRTELLRNNDDIAECINGYLSACRLANMLLFNTKPMVEIPGTYQVFRRFLEHIRTGAPAEPYESLVYLTLLYESGEFPPQDSRAGEFLLQILEKVRNGEPVPPGIPESYWIKLAGWRKSVCRKMIPPERINLR